MKSLLSILLLCAASLSFGQTDSTLVTSDTLIVQDTTDIYVINSTNRMIAVDNSFAIEFRDLKKITEIGTIHFDSVKEVEQFFATCYRVLEQDVKVVGTLYTVSRNKLSKNVVRVDGQSETGYFFLSYDSVEKMEKAFYRTIQK